MAAGVGRPRAVGVAAAALLVGACAPAAPTAAPLVTLTGASMGTTYTVKVAGPLPPGETRASLGATVAATLAAVDGAMSTYRADSELSRLNRTDGTAPIAVSDDLFTVLEEALAVSRLTGGAFDVTVGPLVGAWGFGPQQVDREPTAEELAALRQRVGYRLLELDRAAHTVRKLHRDLSIDLSAIAKGFAVDRVAGRLAASGVANTMVEVGGEVRTAGRNAAGEVWRIGIERPGAERGAVERVVRLDGLAMATSGDYRNFRRAGSSWISHIIDPRTGRPIRQRLASASVVDRRCMVADALATAFMVLGPERGLELAEQQGLAVLFIVADEGGSLREVPSTAFAALIEGSSAAVAAAEGGGAT